MSSSRNLRHALKSIVPNWLADIPGLNVGFAVLYTIALMCDLLVEVMFEGVFAAWPGKGTPTALDLIGRGRGFARGTGETDDAYAARLRGWLDVWPDAGADEVLVRLLQIYLGGNLVIRIVDRRGHFTTINADGSITVVDNALWNFDSVELPARTGWWSDLWIIVYVTDGRWPVYTSRSDPAFLAAWGKSTLGYGHQVPVGVVSDMMTIIATFKGAHSWVESLVFTDDAANFDPAGLEVGFPNGRWGNWSRPIAGTQTTSRATISTGGTIRYWNPNTGG